MKKVILFILFVLFIKSFEVKETIIPAPTPIPVVPQPQPRVDDDRVKQVDVPQKAMRIKDGTLYAQVINTAAKPFYNENKATAAHESIHDINSELRNSRQNSNGFYLTNGKGYVIFEPKLTIAEARQYVPATLRSGTRYNLYFNQSMGWNEQPLYLVDEWVAYIGGAEVYLTEKDIEKTDQIYGPMEFSLYCLCLCMAIEEKDPEFWKNPEFQDFIFELLSRSKSIFDKGHATFTFESQEQFLKKFQTSKDCEKVREFSRKYFKGIWL